MYRSAGGFPHEWCERDPDQQSFWIEEAADGLTPGFFLVLHEHAMSARFELRRRVLDIINVEFRGVSTPNCLAYSAFNRSEDRQSPDECAVPGHSPTITS